MFEIPRVEQMEIKQGQAILTIRLYSMQQHIHERLAFRHPSLTHREFQPAARHEREWQHRQYGIFSACREYMTNLPDDLRASLEYLSGFFMDDVHVHYNSPKPARIQALAYTQGIDIYIGPGQEKYLAHEAWHVVQQKRGGVQPTMQINGVAINDEEELEREADLMGNEVLQVSRGPEPMHRLSRRQPPAFPPVQRQLTDDVLAGYYYDSRDLARREHFTKVGVFPGLTGPYVDQSGYTYSYDDGTRQYQVTGGAANQYWDTVNHQQYTRLLGGTANIFHIYTLQPVTTWTNRYYYLGNLYQQVPTQRVRWVDNQGRFVEAPALGSPRVLTNDGQYVQKHYLLAKDAHRNFVLPIKARQHFFAPNRPTFVPGLPNLFGGNLDPQDANAHAAATREAGEETDFAYTTVNIGLQLGAPVIQGGNQLNFHEGTVRTTAAGEQIGLRAAARPFVQEMDLARGVFTFKAHQIAYQPLVTTDQNIRDQILNLFSVQKAVNLTDVFFTGVVGGRAQTPLQEFHGAHATAALVDKVKADHQAYYSGLARAQAGQQPASADPEHVAGRQLYIQGLQDIQANVAAANPQEPAYMAARTEYTQGLQDIRTNVVAANNNVAYMAARTEYTQGLQNIRANVVAANNNVAYMAARTEYTLAYRQIQETTRTASFQGAGAVLAAQGLAAPPNNHPASLAGHQEYIAGWGQAHGNLPPAQNTPAYMEGYRDYV